MAGTSRIFFLSNLFSISLRSILPRERSIYLKTTHAQVEYAMRAVRQGSACVGIRSDKYVVLASVKRSASELASYQEKLFRVDDHVGIAITGLVADARVLTKYMQTECLNHKYTYESQMIVGRLVENVADKHQKCTQSYVRRPYGVGLLVAGCDKTGPHLYETSPSGCYYEYKAMALGARSNSAKTYLQREFEKRGDDGFSKLTEQELVFHAVRSLKGCLAGDKKLNAQCVSVAVVGVDKSFEHLSDEQVSDVIKEAIGDDEDDTKDNEEEDEDEDDDDV